MHPSAVHPDDENPARRPVSLPAWSLVPDPHFLRSSSCSPPWCPATRTEPFDGRAAPSWVNHSKGVPRDHHQALDLLPPCQDQGDVGRNGSKQQALEGRGCCRQAGGRLGGGGGEAGVVRIRGRRRGGGERGARPSRAWRGRGAASGWGRGAGPHGTVEAQGWRPPRRPRRVGRQAGRRPRILSSRRGPVPAAAQQSRRRRQGGRVGRRAATLDQPARLAQRDRERQGPELQRRQDRRGPAQRRHPHDLRPRRRHFDHRHRLEHFSGSGLERRAGVAE